MADGSASHIAPANGGGRNEDRGKSQAHDGKITPNHAVVEDGEEEESDDFAVRREGEDDDDDEDEEDEKDEKDDEYRRRLIDDEADDDSEWESLPESDTIDSSPPSTPSDPGAYSDFFYGDEPKPIKRKKKPTSSVDPDAGPKTFPQFERLPAELRLRIWEMHCPYLREQRRVIRVTLMDSPLLMPWSLLPRQTRAMRQFMRICPEARAVGLRILPDELAVEYGIVRFNAETDIVHIDHQDDHLLYDPLHRYTSKRLEAAVLARLPKKPYAHVRNIAVQDCEIRSREPGAYIDYEYGRRIIEFWAPDMVSHQRPQELRHPSVSKTLLDLFPKLDNVYVVERANKRRINAWVGDLRPGNHQQFRIHTKEGDSEWKGEVDYVYCWHEPPPVWLKKRRADRVARRARKKAEAAATGSVDGDGESDGDIGCGTDDETVPLKGSDGKIEGDWDNDIVVNTMAVFRDRGVRFSRMLLFELDEGLMIYHELRRECKPEGVWPVDSKGEPMQDDPPLFDDDGMDEESYDEYESSGIDDDDLEDEDESDDDGEDGDEIIHAEHDTEGAPANFSSPEGSPSEAEDEDEDEDEGKGEGEGEVSSQRRRKRRCVVTDSDDESAGNGEGSAGQGLESDSDGPPPAKRMTLAERLSRAREENPVPPEWSDEEEGESDEGDAGDYGPQYDDDEDDEDNEDNENEM